MEEQKVHKALLGPDHIPGDEWECECSESFETKAELMEHIEDERFAASPKGQLNKLINDRIQAEIKYPERLYVQGLWAQDEFLAYYKDSSPEKLDEAIAKHKQILEEVRNV
jgi:hypothetical protein